MVRSKEKRELVEYWKSLELWLVGKVWLETLAINIIRIPLIIDIWIFQFNNSPPHPPHPPHPPPPPTPPATPTPHPPTPHPPPTPIFPSDYELPSAFWDNIGSGNGLPLIRWQGLPELILTYCQLEHQGQIPVNFLLKYKHLHRRKFITKCSPNGNPLVTALMC